MEWLLSMSPIYLRDWLPLQYHQAHVKLVYWLSLCLNRCKKSDLPRIKEGIAEFVSFFEEHYYQYKKEHLHICRSQIHALLYLADAISACGPLNVYNQFSMEQMLGLITAKSRSQSSMSRSISLTCLQIEQL